MPLKLPALDPATLPENRGTTYPEPFKSRLGDRARRRLGNACGLTQFGVNLVTLGPGGQSALRHAHSREDEFVYVLSGELVLIANGGEQVLKAGMCAGYPCGSGDAHHMLNRSKQLAQYLEIGTRVDDDEVTYPDDDLRWVKRGGKEIPAHKDGRLY